MCLTCPTLRVARGSFRAAAILPLFRTRRFWKMRQELCCQTDHSQDRRVIFLCWWFKIDHRNSYSDDCNRDQRSILSLPTLRSSTEQETIQLSLLYFNVYHLLSCLNS